MKITVLAENTCKTNDFEAEHGLCLYIQTQNHNILFDCGQSDMFERNAKKLGIDLKNVDIVIISHGHYDHTGGLKRFFQINNTAKIYLSKYAFGEHYSGIDRYIGMDKELKEITNLIYTDDYFKIDDELLLCSLNDKIMPEDINCFGLTMKQNDRILPEDFRHEQYLLINENGKKIVISGCSHKGIVNICSKLCPDVLIGGFHFSKADINTEQGRQFLTESAQMLCAHNCIYYTCHCTGVQQYEYLKALMQQKLHYISSGDVFYI